MYCLSLFTLLIINLFKFILLDVDVLMVYNDMFSSDCTRSSKACRFNYGVGVCSFLCPNALFYVVL